MIKRFWKTICGLTIVCCFARAVAADELDQLMTTLRGISEAAAAKSPDKSDPSLRTITELEAAIVAGNVERALGFVRRLTSATVTDAELKSAAEQLQRDLPRLLHARRDVFLADVAAALKRTREECLAATAESDLEPLFRHLGALKQRQGSAEGSPVIARALRKLDSAIKLVESWMDYLLASGAGNKERGNLALRRVLNDADGYPIVPSAELEKRIGASRDSTGTLADILPALAKIKTLRDVETVAPEIDRVPARTENSYNQDVENLQRWFLSFRAATAAYLSGDIGEAWRRISSEQTSYTERWFSQVLRLRSMLLDDLIVQVLKLPADARRRPDETSADHSRRLLTEAVEQGRWEDVQRYASTRANVPLVPGSSSNPFVELAGAASNFLRARRLEEAGDIVSAILAYNAVLRITADFAPIRQATERLKALRISHPEAFAEAHPRIDSDRAVHLIGQLERTLNGISSRLDVFEEQRKPNPPSGSLPAPTVAQGSPSKAEFAAVQTKLKELEATTLKASQLNDRLQRLELLLGPGAEVLARQSEDQTRFRIWLGQDFTVYRSALPPQMEKSLGWKVLYNGKSVLSRNARNEFVYRYHNFRPGNYTIYLTLDSAAPVSNMVEFTISEEESRKLRQVPDRDWDRDGVPNADESGDCCDKRHREGGEGINRFCDDGAAVGALTSR